MAKKCPLSKSHRYRKPSKLQPRYINSNDATNAASHKMPRFTCSAHTKSHKLCPHYNKFRIDSSFSIALSHSLYLNFVLFHSSYCHLFPSHLSMFVFSIRNSTVRRPWAGFVQRHHHRDRWGAIYVIQTHI